MNDQNLQMLMALMLTDIGAKLSIISPPQNPSELGSHDYEKLNQFLSSGDLWAAQETYSGCSWPNKNAPSEVAEVCDIFAMWDDVRNFYSRLTPQEKEQVLTNIDGIPYKEEFPGFDHSNETAHAHVAEVLVTQLNKFAYITPAEAVKNSHFQILSRYRAMLVNYNLIKRAQGWNGSLNINEITRIIAAR